MMRRRAREVSFAGVLTEPNVVMSKQNVELERVEGGRGNGR
jgi:hypothetical protein